MHPLLFEIGALKLHTYGALMGAGFLLAMQLLLRRGAKEGVNEAHLNQCILFAFIFGILGARLLFVFVDNPGAYLRNPLEVFKIWKGGLVFFGGFLLATIAIGYNTYRKGLNVLQVYDLICPVLVIAHAMGRAGCFMAGCCYGKACDYSWAVTFTHPDGVGLKHIPLHPTQIYSGVFLTSLFFLLLWVRGRKRFHGMVAVVYLTVYAIGRSTIEVFRGDIRGEWLGLSTSQLISIPVALGGIIMLYIGIKSRNRTISAQTS